MEQILNLVVHTLDHLVFGSELHRELLNLLLHFLELPLEGLDLVLELLDLATVRCALVLLLVQLRLQELKLLGLARLLLLELLDAPQLLPELLLVAVPFLVQPTPQDARLARRGTGSASGLLHALHLDQLVLKALNLIL